MPKADRAGRQQTSRPQGRQDSHKDAPRSFPIVGIGASAGGLRAFEEFFTNMPAGSGMAFVLVQHLDPEHESSLAELLQRCSEMPVRKVTGEIVVEADHVYVIPSGNGLTLDGGKLYLTERGPSGSVPVVIDRFFRSLAKDQGDNAIGIVLSGTGSEGAQGLGAIKEVGGVTLAQDEGEAEYGGMPHAAIASGHVDVVLPVSRMPAKLLEIKGHSVEFERPEASEPPEDGEADVLKQIFARIRGRTGHDFSHYKKSSILRRVRRRMQIGGWESLSEYLDQLQGEPAETEKLFREILIGVSSFFRDAEPMSALEKALPNLLANKGPEDTVRAWVPACASGQEAYSLAMLLTEACAKLEQPPRLQLFATDIDAEALATARRGHYPGSIAADVSTERLERFFVEKSGGFQVTEALRETVLFCRHDLLRDPPFSKLDIISCRNLLIYLNTEIQPRVFGLFHFALKPGGYLFLGASESLGRAKGKFADIDRKANLFRRREGPAELTSFPITGAGPTGHVPRKDTATGRGISELAERHLLERYAPPCVIIDGSHAIRYVSGRLGRYLELAPGEPTQDILELAREGLALELRTAVHQASASGQGSTRRIRVRTEGGVQAVDLTVEPIPDTDGLQLVAFADVERSAEDDAGESENGPAARERVPGQEAAAVIAELEAELKRTKTTLTSAIEEHETTNDELHASNEELQATNEELQSTSEELETSKEELQSSNEELTTVNQELRNKVAEVTEVNSVLDNLIASTDIVTIFLDGKLRLRRYTPRAAELFHLIPGDIGRPFAHVAPRLDDQDLLNDAEKVNESRGRLEREILSEGGDWFLTRVLPYRTVEGEIDGVVITLIDITQRKRSELAAEAARNYAQGIVDTVREPLMVLDGELRVQSASTAFYRNFQTGPEQTEGKYLYDLGDGQWNIPELRTLLTEVLTEVTTVEDFEVRHDFPGLGQRTMLLNARRLTGPVGPEEMILLAIADITERMRAEQALKESHDSLEYRVAERTSELGALNRELDSYNYSVSHDLRAPLRGLDGFSRILLEDYGDKLDDSGKHYLERIRKGAERMGELIDDLLRLSRLSHARMKPQELNLSALAHAVVADLRDREPERDVSVDIEEEMTAYGDVELLRIALENLLQNAWKFTRDRDDGQVEIRVEKLDGESVFSLRDNGIGFSMEYADKLFAPFQRLHSGDRFEGTGIGLAIVQRIIHKHGGRVWAEGHSGKGASFHFTLGGPAVRLPKERVPS